MENLLKEAHDYVVKEYGSAGYDFWRALIAGDPIVLSHPNDSQMDVEISAMWDRVKPGGPIRVVVSLFPLIPKEFSVRVPTATFLALEDGSVRIFE